MGHTILLVDRDPETRSQRAGVLTEAGYLVVTAATFKEALYRLSFELPDLLLTDIRLGEYNGLHLVMRSRRERPDIGTLVTHDVADRILEAEASRLGAIYLTKDAEPAVLLAVTERLLAGVAPRLSRGSQPRRWPRMQPGAAVAARLGGEEAHLVNVSCGGACVELSDRLRGDGAGGAELRVPAADLAVRMRPVWAARTSAGGAWRCGLEVAEPEPRLREGWEAFVATAPSIGA